LRILLWSEAGEDVPPYTYSIGIHVENAEGTLVAQADYGLPPAPSACHIANIDTRDLEPGTYTVYVLVYAWENGERLPGRTAKGEEGDRLRLGEFVIKR
jgi:hypothetical protein